MAIHDFDMARHLLDEEPVEVFAAGSCLVDPAIENLETSIPPELFYEQLPVDYASSQTVVEADSDMTNELRSSGRKA